MPEFLNPFPGRVPERKLGKEELVRALRLDLVAEHEAVHLYLAHADACDDPLPETVLRDTADEERKHMGEFMRLIPAGSFLQKGGRAPTGALLLARASTLAANRTYIGKGLKVDG